MEIGTPSAPATPSTAWHKDFLELLPGLQRHARWAFRACRCGVRREEASQECAALAWQWYVGLRQRGQDVRRFPGVFAATVVRAVRCGRRLCGQERARDVLSPVAQQRLGFRVELLGASGRLPTEVLYGLVQGQEELDAYEARLHDNASSSPAEAAAFRIDFPEFLARMTQRDRNLAMYLSLGHGTTPSAARFGLSPARVSQLRRQWSQDWQTFHGESEPSSAAPAFASSSS